MDSNSMIIVKDGKQDNNFIIKDYIPNIVSISKETLKQRVIAVDKMYKCCKSCGRDCRIDRFTGDKQKLGKCKTGSKAAVYSHFPHMGEEKCLVGQNGSGTIFFSNCNLQCIFCQNWQVSQTGKYAQDLSEVTDQQLAEIMIELQSKGCHNINFVSPSHVVGPIIKALVIAKELGLKLPLVYNTGGYEQVDTLRLLDGIIDIYLPDMKYSDASLGLLYSGIENYPQINQKAVLEMQRQVGDLKFNEAGLAQRGLIIRHLVLPQNQAGTEEIAKFIKEQVSSNAYINLMDQYRPENKAKNHKILGRQINTYEYIKACDIFKQYKLYRLDEKSVSPKRMFLLQCQNKDTNW